jgi:hypothetical protein
VRETLNFLGVKKENIFEFKNAKKDEMITLKCKMIVIFQKARETKKKTFCYTSIMQAMGKYMANLQALK